MNAPEPHALAQPRGAAPPLIASVVRAMRPRQWTKNGALLLPLVFAKGIVREGLLLKSLLAVLAFSTLASGVYLVNDWVDREKDLMHPEKRLRPIAAGLLKFPVVVGLVIALWTATAAIGWQLGQSFLGVLAGYLVLQVFYTLGLKHLVILDVMSIALGFIFRVVAGAVAINVEVSNWLFLCTLLGAVFLGFAKRRHELSSLNEDAASHRQNLEDYSLPMLDQMMAISAASVILAYGLYTMSADTLRHVGNDRLKYTVPVVVYGVFRYVFLVHKRGAGGAPEKVLLSDVPTILTLGVFFGIAVWALYF
jgi:4-hydroxybenzoate polyprenyltransferase